MPIETRNYQRCDRCERFPVLVYLVDGEWVCGRCRGHMDRTGDIGSAAASYGARMSDNERLFGEELP